MGRINGGKWRWLGLGEVVGEMETTVLEQHLKNKKKELVRRKSCGD